MFSHNSFGGVVAVVFYLFKRGQGAHINAEDGVMLILQLCMYFYFYAYALHLYLYPSLSD